MNTENLLKAAAYIRTIPQSKFDMGTYRQDGTITHECNSVGCAVGHCSVLDTSEHFHSIVKGYFTWNLWATDFFGLTDNEWTWCFTGCWDRTDNTPEGAALRMEWLINHGLPDNWEQQIDGDEPLCYRP